MTFQRKSNIITTLLNNVAGDQTNWSTTYTSFGGVCIFRASATGYTSSGSAVLTLNLVIDSVIVNSTSHFIFSASNSTVFSPPINYATVLSAGSHTIALTVTGTGHTTDSGDYANLIVEESQSTGLPGITVIGSGSSVVLGLVGGRLSLTSGVPITTTDVTGAGILYYTPDKSKEIATYDTGVWTQHSFAELSLPLTITSGKNYDVFVDGTGTLTLSSAWTDDVTRADALAAQDGIAVLSSDHSKRHLGTIRASGTNTCEDSVAKRFVSNLYNATTRDLFIRDTTASWTYATNTWRPANGSTANCFEYVTCLTRRIKTDVIIPVQGAGVGWSNGVGIDSTTTNSAQRHGCAAGPGQFFQSIASYFGSPGLGYHKITWLEIAWSGLTVTSYGTDGGTGSTGLENGMAGEILG